ncbi:helix-turn-helix domain-containing protein [Streptomyces sp. CAI-21]|nr:helix-turn-helix domain-containing protein [Streptomyces sp. CAI-21]
MTLTEAAKYIGRSRSALKTLRHRRRGPRSFLADGRIYYYVADLDAWLAGQASADSRFNPALDPTRAPAQPRRSRRSRVPAAA